MISSLSRRLGIERRRLYVRYALTSVASVGAGQLTLATCFGMLGWTAEVSNLVAFVVGGIVSYTMNRRWTWQRRGRSSVLREIIPFWALALAGLLLSTWAVGLAEDGASSIAKGRAVQTLFVMLASLSAFGTVWVVKFIAFDRFIFRSAGAAPAHGAPGQDPEVSHSE